MAAKSDSTSVKSAAKPTVRDVARAAGVSLATVDRVLNRRKGVRQATIEKVERAVAELNFERDVSASLMARSKSAKIHFVLPDGANPFMHQLERCIVQEVAALTGSRIEAEILHIPALDPEALALKIDELTGLECDCAIIVANDDDAVRRSVARALVKGLPVVTLVSDLPQSKRRAFVGIDNEAAGRTAASLLGRFCPPGSQVGLIVGSLDLRDHRDRFIGFSEVMLDEYPSITVAGPAEGFDDMRETARRVNEMLSDNPRLAGIYSIGAGNEGLLHTLKQRVNPGRLRVIAHELTDITRDALQAGYVDAILHQNPVNEVRKALEHAQKLILSKQADLDRQPIEIGIYLRDNLPAVTPATKPAERAKVSVEADRQEADEAAGPA